MGLRKFKLRTVQIFGVFGMVMGWVFILVFAQLALSPVANATLGEPESSVDQDVQRLHLAHKRNQTAKYSSHVLASSTSQVTEYAAPDGTVFEVTWVGMVPPDLSVLLGSYYSEYVDADQKDAKQKAAIGRPRNQGRAGVSLKTARMVVQRGGHMRALHGRVIAPALVPAGVKAEALP